MSARYLILEDGQVFAGEAAGAQKMATGELVFTTGMGGYLETLTDPSFCGQLVLETFPVIGAYGVIEADFEGECALSGYIAREICARPSNFRCQYALNDFLVKKGVPAITGVDTRQITRILRSRGVMNAILSDTRDVDISLVKAHALPDPVARVTRKGIDVLSGGAPRVVIVDDGMKKSVAEAFISRGCGVIAVPADTKPEEILRLKPDGILVSNGPGDPRLYTQRIRNIAALMGKVPMMGICLGHQLMALAAGCKAEKLKFGHRGENQPVRDMKTGRLYVTSQNHGYALSSLAPGCEKLFENVNDHTNEGLEYIGKRAFSAQFHPESAPGPRDTGFLFDRFISMMGGEG